MEKIRITIIEDEFVIAEDMRVSLEQHGYEVAHVFDRAEEALPNLLQEMPHIILVDIQLLGKMNGIELVQQLQTNRQVPIIYITANSDQATFEKAKATYPHAFLIKPFTPNNLIASIELALFNFSKELSPEKIERINQVDPQKSVIIHQTLFVKLNGRFKKIISDDILFAEASGSYVNIQTTEQRYTLSQNLAQFQRKTPLPNFIKIHRSYVVNITKIDSFEDSFVFIQNHKLPLSENHKPEFLSRIHLL